MKRTLASAGTLFLLAACCTDLAWGQIPRYSPGPGSGTGGPSLRRSTRPVISPYTNLLSTGVGANNAIGQQYFNLTRPQIQTNRALNALGQSVNRLQAYSQAGTPMGLSAQQQLLMQQAAGLSTIGPTGHPVGYMSHSIYFGTNGRSSASGGGTAGTTPSFGSPAAAGGLSGGSYRR